MPWLILQARYVYGTAAADHRKETMTPEEKTISNKAVAIICGNTAVEEIVLKDGAKATYRIMAPSKWNKAIEEITEILVLLAEARHELVTLDGMVATDKKDAQPGEYFTIGTMGTIKRIDKILG